MNQPPPYDDAPRAFLIMDNGASHRGERCAKRLRGQHPNLVPVPGLGHASCLNQIETFFSILQRKAVTPNDFPSLEAIAEHIMGFGRYYESIADPSSGKSHLATWQRCSPRSNRLTFSGGGMTPMDT